MAPLSRLGPVRSVVAQARGISNTDDHATGHDNAGGSTMRLEDIAIHFADQLCRTRTLTTAESDMLLALVEKRRREWSPDEIQRLREMKAARRLAPAIARELGRSAQAVRTMVRDLKRRDARG